MSENRGERVKKKTIKIIQGIEDLYGVVYLEPHVIKSELLKIKKHLDGCLVGMKYTEKEAKKTQDSHGRRLN
tara:strand:- start:7237 stop:7452 length:216 start_codon:yes stop_codon:yes gene_type:complete